MLLVCLGRSNKVPQAGKLKQQTFIVDTWEAGSPRIKVWAGLVSPSASLHAVEMVACSLCPHMVAPL